MRRKIKHLPLKTIYYSSFLILIVIPILVVLLVALMILNHQFKNQAIENIKRAQETIIADLKSDEDVMSIRLSHMVYTNNNEILELAAGTDSDNYNERNQYEKQLSESANLVLEPVKDIVSVTFYMKDGKKSYIKNEIKRSYQELKAMEWYQSALKKHNTVCVGFFDSKATNDLYAGNKKDSLILVFALSPDVMTDRSQRIEMVMFFQMTAASERIKENNRDYLTGKNKLGITQITDRNGKIVFDTHTIKNLSSGEYTCVKSPIRFNNYTWYIENYIKTSELTAAFWSTAVFVFAAAVVILLLAGYFSSYFLRSIVNPIGAISIGLRQVEEGNLEVHLSPAGQFEVRTVIHQFNAMVRRLKALVNEYEEKIKNAEQTPQDYFAAMIKGELTPEVVNKRSREFFAESYAILGFYIDNGNRKDKKKDHSSKLLSCFERNPRFASRCLIYQENATVMFGFYRITENDYSYHIEHMAEELQRSCNQELGVKLFLCIGQKITGYEEFENQIQEIRGCLCLRHLKGRDALVNLNCENEKVKEILKLETNYKKLAEALYIADEKNLTQEKDRIFDSFTNCSMEEVRNKVFAAILAIGNCFSRENSDFTEVFSEQYNYFDKIRRIEDIRSIKLWLTNYFTWIMEYSASKLNVTETDAIIKAKHYISDHYENADLSLLMVAEHVGLNEKYFTNRFTKETGETFTSYLTTLRIQKSKELLKSTNFKIYEISEMVGYRNVEHFNRTFKKLCGNSPAGYRKDN